MNATTKTALTVAVAVVAALLLFFNSSSGTMSGSMITGGVMGHAEMAGVGWMWMPTLLSFVLGALLAWAIFGQKK